MGVSFRTSFALRTRKAAIRHRAAGHKDGVKAAAPWTPAAARMMLGQGNTKTE